VTLGVRGAAILLCRKEAHLAWRVADSALVFVDMNRQFLFGTLIRLDASAQAGTVRCVTRVLADATMCLLVMSASRADCP
jgi:hypothetical protein